MNASQFANEFAEGFAALDKHNLARLADLYDAQIHFTDPLHDVHGLDALRSYCENLYSNVSDLQFEFLQCSGIDEDQALLRWNMRYSHPRQNNLRPWLHSNSVPRRQSISTYRLL